MNYSLFLDWRSSRIKWSNRRYFFSSKSLPYSWIICRLEIIMHQIGAIGDISFLLKAFLNYSLIPCACLQLLPLLLLLKQASMPWPLLQSVWNLRPHNLGSKCRRIKAVTAANGHTQQQFCKVDDITLHLHMARYWKLFCKLYEGFSFD